MNLWTRVHVIKSVSLTPSAIKFRCSCASCSVCNISWNKSCNPDVTEAILSTKSHVFLLAADKHALVHGALNTEQSDDYRESPEMLTNEISETALGDFSQWGALEVMQYLFAPIWHVDLPDRRWWIISKLSDTVILESSSVPGAIPGYLRDMAERQSPTQNLSVERDVEGESSGDLPTEESSSDKNHCTTMEPESGRTSTGDSDIASGIDRLLQQHRRWLALIWLKIN